MLEIEENKKFIQFGRSINIWTELIQDNNITYNTQALYDHLQSREQKALLSDKNLFFLVESFNEDYGKLTNRINKDFSESEAIVKKLEELDIIVKEKLSGNYRDYVVQSGLSVWALYYYRSSEFDKAINLSEQCIDIVDKLIKKGIPSLIFRAIEMNKNLSRVYLKMGEIEKSDSINSSILSYHLKSWGTNNLYGSNFKEIDLWNEMPYLRECFGYYFFIEYCSDMRLDNLHYNKDRFNAIFQNVADIDVDNIDRYFISEWIKIQKLFFANKIDQFLYEVSQYLENSIHRFYQEPIMVLLDEAIVIISKSNYVRRSILLLKLEDFKISMNRKVTKEIV